jgi:hypothetical protein
MSCVSRTVKAKNPAQDRRWSLSSLALDAFRSGAVLTFGSICRLILFGFSALANLLPCRLTSRFFLYLGLSVLGLSCLRTSTSVLAAQIALAWDAIRDPNVAGYIVYYGYASGHYEGAVDVQS